MINQMRKSIPLAAIFILLAAMNNAHADTEKSEEQKKFEEELEKRCPCMKEDKCNDLVKCMNEQDDCGPTFVDMKNAYSAVDCDEKKMEVITCKFGILLRSEMANNTQSRKKREPEVPECVGKLSKGLTCEGYKEDGDCLRKAFANCSVFVDYMEKATCANVDFMDDENLIAFAKGEDFKTVKQTEKPETEESKPEESKSEESKPEASKPAETKPAETIPSETKPEVLNSAPPQVTIMTVLSIFFLTAY